MTVEERAEDYLERKPKYPGDDHAIPIIEDLLRLYRAEKIRSRGDLKDAIDCVEEWGGYAGDYFKEKHGYYDDMKRLKSALNRP